MMEGFQKCLISLAKFEGLIIIIGWFQKISIPIPRAGCWNSEGEGGLRRLEFRRHGGIFRRATSSLV